MTLTPSLPRAFGMRRDRSSRMGATPRDMVRTMGIAGLSASFPAGLIVSLIWMLDSVQACLSAAIGAAGAIVFSGLGHMVQWLWANASVPAQLVAALSSYGTRVGLFGMGLALYLSLGNSTGLHSVALVTGCVTVVVVWLIAEVMASSRLRILCFDDPDPNEEVPR
ncbi:hypothetical protein [Propioniferax innocua]|uniref:ATP synthase protein I n=1 Tax=Propioniferax innocua TaxID=1753 RepID=A0A542ZBA6_9ACTN|nr:hypothetical protein [Propioniferax innocua]TQL57592.1 hypothetical protein FB460_1425 [Propioniferax innocua]